MVADFRGHRQVPTFKTGFKNQGLILRARKLVIGFDIVIDGFVIGALPLQLTDVTGPDVPMAIRVAYLLIRAIRVLLVDYIVLEGLANPPQQGLGFWRKLLYGFGIRLKLWHVSSE